MICLCITMSKPVSNGWIDDEVDKWQNHYNNKLSEFTALWKHCVDQELMLDLAQENLKIDNDTFVINSNFFSPDTEKFTLFKQLFDQSSFVQTFIDAGYQVVIDIINDFDYDTIYNIKDGFESGGVYVLLDDPE